MSNLKQPGLFHRLWNHTSIRLIVIASLLSTYQPAKAQLQGSLPPGALRVTTETESYWEYASAPDYMPPIADLRRIEKTHAKHKTEFIPGQDDWFLSVEVENTSEEKMYPEQVILKRFEFTPDYARAYDAQHQLISDYPLMDQFKDQMLTIARNSLSVGVSPPDFSARLHDSAVARLLNAGFVMSQQGLVTTFTQQGLKLSFDREHSAIRTTIYELSDELFAYPIREAITYYTWAGNKYLPGFKVYTTRDTLSDGVCAKNIRTVKYSNFELGAEGGHPGAQDRSEVKFLKQSFQNTCYAGTEKLTVFFDAELARELASQDRDITFLVHDLSGRNWLHQSVPVVKGTQQYELPNPNLPAGWYLLAAHINGNIHNIPLFIHQ